MAFGINRRQLREWKSAVKRGEIAFLTHYWLDDRFPDINTVTKVGCSDIGTLAEWGRQYGLKPEWIHAREEYPHFDLMGKRQVDILKQEEQLHQLTRLKNGKHNSL
ncbi:hypothetical protein SporoP37_01130 [Sporosarcina sp. P37]|uniref:hypothetical protein n=1 Tax=unclassified Sporosarcina TaxID=2647733 RepID=UPI0009C017F7|nr:MULTISPECIES: hypothetical protein [unclassified Sporosarcina]ARD46905.1 hypothetical protein SporoP33_00725 [Sporosarcina sp. P33]ARK23431.1 hypothetical protein SporoP37_01130 [Sporosarcina sp. P37]PID18641.1 hypothetical protein CSV62_07245 [Sporosarcina sp. P35]